MPEQPPEPHTWETYESSDDPTGAPQPSGSSPASSPYQAGRFTRYDSGREVRRLRRRVATAVVGILAVLGVSVLGIGWAGMQGMEALGDLFDRDSPVIAPPAQAAEPVDLFTTSGTAALVAALEAETGTSRATHAVFYRDYGVVTVPGDGTTGERSYYWDGELSDTGTVLPGARPFDLARVDGRVFGDLCTPKAATEPNESCFAIVERPLGGRGWLDVHGGQRESHIIADLRGRIVD